MHRPSDKEILNSRWSKELERSDQMGARIGVRKVERTFEHHESHGQAGPAPPETLGVGSRDRPPPDSG